MSGNRSADMKRTAEEALSSSQDDRAAPIWKDLQALKPKLEEAEKAAAKRDGEYDAARALLDEASEQLAGVTGELGDDLVGLLKALAKAEASGNAKKAESLEAELDATVGDDAAMRKQVRKWRGLRDDVDKMDVTVDKAYNNKTAADKVWTALQDEKTALEKQKVAGLSPQSLWGSAFRLNQPAFILSDEMLKRKTAKSSSRTTTGWPKPDEVKDWKLASEVRCPVSDINTTERFVLAKDGLRRVGAVAHEADLVSSILTPVLNTVFKHGVQDWFCSTADLHMEYPVKQGVIPDGLIFPTFDSDAPVLALEAKHPFAYEPRSNGQSLADQWNKAPPGSKPEKLHSSSPIRQVYTYMCLGETTYGVLTTYQKTWFLRRSLVQVKGEQKSVLEISEPFYPESTKPTLAQAYVYVVWLALQPGGKLVTPESAKEYVDEIKTKQKKAIKKGKQTRANNNRDKEEQEDEDEDEEDEDEEDEDEEGHEGADGAAKDGTLPLDEIHVTFKPTESYGPLQHGVAHRMDVHGYDAVMKLVDAYKDPAGADLLRHEEKTYMELKDLWSTVLPSLVGSGRVSLGREMLAITYEGQSLDRVGDVFTQEQLKTLKRKARESLAKLHERGYLHGDVAARNIVYDSKRDSVKLIDLGLSSKAGSSSDYQDELRQIDDVFDNLN